MGLMQSSSYQQSPAAPVYTKKEYLRTAGDTDKSFENQWGLFPKQNPLVQTLSHGMSNGAETNLVRRTSNMWDMRGEPEPIRNLTNVTLPGHMINTRQNEAAIERSMDRELQRPRMNSP